MTEAPPPVRLGGLPGGTVPRAMLALALLGAPAAGIGWWQISVGARDAFAVDLGFVLATVGTLVVVLSLAFFALARRSHAGGSLDASGMQVGGKRLAWSEVSRLGLRAVPGGREVLLAYPKDETGTVRIGVIPTGQREPLLSQIEQWSGRRVGEE